MVLFCILKEDQSQRKIEAEDIEKLSDSNSDIKGRLSEIVRENAKEMLDPERKVNGQPVPVHQPQLFTGGVMRWYQVEGIEWLRVSRPQRNYQNKMLLLYKNTGIFLNSGCAQLSNYHLA